MLANAIVPDEITQSPSMSNGRDEYAVQVLAVDDEQVNLRVIEAQLSGGGVDVRTASGGEEALEEIENEPYPEIVLLDIMMPGMDGYEVCRRIRERHDAGTLPVILLTAKNRVDDLVEGLSAGANDFISKPCTGKELVARINRHLEIAANHRNFGRFVPRDLLRILGGDRPGSVKKGAHVERDMTVMMIHVGADRTGSERYKETFAFLTALLDGILPIIRANGGAVQRYVGDRLLCLFPLEATGALRTAAVP